MNPDDPVGRHILQARQTLAAALSLTQSTLPAPRSIQQLQPTGDPGCLAHRKAGAPFQSSGRVKGTCDWHYDYTRKYHHPCPPELTHRHDAGYTVTDAHVAQAHSKKPLTTKAKPSRTPSRRQRMLTRIANLTSRPAPR